MHRFCRFAVVLLGMSWLFVVPVAAAQAAILITIDKASQRMTVEVDGRTRWAWPVSTGRQGYDTPSGSFRPFRLEEDHYSREWDDAPMPHSIFFTEAGHAIHGSYETRKLGRPASHGCVRLSPNNAAKLFRLVKRKGLSNARVTVIGDSDAPLVAKRRAPAREAVEERRIYAVPAGQAYGYAPLYEPGYPPAYGPRYAPAYRPRYAPVEPPVFGPPVFVR